MFNSEKIKELENRIEQLEDEDKKINAEKIYLKREYGIFAFVTETLDKVIEKIEKRVTEIENAINKMNQYAEANSYTVMDMEEGVNNIFKDLKSAKEFINKMNQKNKPFKMNKRLQKALNKGEKNA